jgi:acetamidase/formamidase
VRTSKDLPSKVLNFPFVNPLAGPFFVKGAEPGDTLAIHFVKIRPSRDQGFSATIPRVGALTGTNLTATLQQPLEERVWVYEIDRERQIATFQALDSSYRVELPIHPFLGTVGVSPQLESKNSRIPDSYGGNMDTLQTCAGNTLFLGVNVTGGMLSLGDGHYLQGHGELCGAAIEGATSTTLMIDLIKKTICEWPRIVSDEYIMSVGSCRPLEDAYRIALSELVNWISKSFDLSLMDSYQLVSQVNEAEISNVVDPNYTVVGKVSRRHLPKVPEVFIDIHEKLRALSKT